MPYDLDKTQFIGHTITSDVQHMFTDRTPNVLRNRIPKSTYENIDFYDRIMPVCKCRSDQEYARTKHRGGICDFQS